MTLSFAVEKVRRRRVEEENGMERERRIIWEKR